MHLHTPVTRAAAKPTPAMRERGIEAYCTRKVRELGGICAKHVSPGRAGSPDRLIALPGRPAALLELKRPGEVPRPLQAQRIAEWCKLGVLADWASTFDEVDRFLERVATQSCPRCGGSA